MTNLQCYSYAVLALHELDIKIDPDVFYVKLYQLWDIYTEEYVEKLVKKKEENGELQ